MIAVHAILLRRREKVTSSIECANSHQAGANGHSDVIKFCMIPTTMQIPFDVDLVCGVSALSGPATSNNGVQMNMCSKNEIIP